MIKNQLLKPWLGTVINSVSTPKFLFKLYHSSTNPKLLSISPFLSTVALSSNINLGLITLLVGVLATTPTPAFPSTVKTVTEASAFTPTSRPK